MSQDKNSDKFRYSYYAPTESERREIDDIRKAYMPLAEKSALEQMRALDKRVRTLPFALALCLGIAGMLIFGTGFALCLEWNEIPWGIAVAAVGAAMMIIAYPVHNALLSRNKQKYRDEILRLSGEALRPDEPPKE